MNMINGGFYIDKKNDCKLIAEIEATNSFNRDKLKTDY